MEFTVDKSIFEKALACVQDVTSKKTPMQILNNVLICIKENEFTCTATDLHSSVFVNGEAKVAGEGSFCVNAKSLHDIIKNFPSDSIKLSNKEDGFLSIKGEKCKFQIAFMSGDDFPSIPMLPNDGFSKISNLVFLNILNKTIFSASDNESRGSISSVLFESTDGVLKVVSTDGHRLTISKTNDFPFVFAEKTLIKRKALTDLKKILSVVDEKESDITIKDNVLFLKNGNIAFSIRTDNDKYPNYERVVPDKFTSSVTVSKKDLLGALKRVALLSVDEAKLNPVSLFSSNMFLKIFADGAEQGNASEEIIMSMEGDKFDVALSSIYLTDAVSRVDSDDCLLRIVDNSSPICVDSGDFFRCYIMPVRL